jgi:transcriptional regulator with XRE-family HTH domain
MDGPVESDRSPNSVDLHVGMRIRLRRRSIGLSQERLAEALGLTFQQVQKYERGVNRVSASKLYEIARILHAPITSFFDGLVEPETLDRAVVKESSGADFVYDLAMTPEGLELASLFPKVDRRHRRLMVEMARALSEASEVDSKIN